MLDRWLHFMTAIGQHLDHIFEVKDLNTRHCQGLQEIFGATVTTFVQQILHQDRLDLSQVFRSMMQSY